MKRRDFIKSALATGGVLGFGPHLLHGRAANDAPVDPAIKRVLVMFKCHFDAGFIDTQANVVQWYFERYFPKAIQTAAAVRQEGNDRYVWTTGSWLIYQYLEKAAGAAAAADGAGPLIRGYCLARDSVHLADGDDGPFVDCRGPGFFAGAGPPVPAHHHRRQDDRRDRPHARHHRPARRARSQASRYRPQWRRAPCRMFRRSSAGKIPPAANW